MRSPALTLLIPGSVLSTLAVSLFCSPSNSSVDPGSSPSPLERRSFCFAPNTDAETVSKYDAPAEATEAGASFLLSTTLTRALQVSDRWGTTATNGSTQSSQGDPVTLRWSIVPDDTFINSGGVDGEVSSGSDLRARLAEIYGGSATGAAADQPWFSVFEAAFESLGSQTGLTFVHEPAEDGATLSTSARGIIGTRGDIRIAGHELDGNSNVLAYNYFPDYGDMVIDTADSYFENTSNSSIRLRNVLEHEFGHGLGLDHVCPSNGTKLMEPTISLSFTGAQFDTIYSLQRNYGDPFEKLSSALDNDSLATATAVPVETGVGWTSGYLGIDDNSDTDYLSFEATAGTVLTATITPTANSYLEGAQLSDGSCGSGTTFDSSRQQDLTLTLYDESGAEVATAASGALGEPETLSSIAIANTGTHYLRITGSGANSNQLYTTEVLLEVPEVSLQITSTTLTAELFSEQNGAPDPSETIELSIGIENIGEVDALGVEALLSGPDSLIPLIDSAQVGDIASGGETNFSLIFALEGDCGETVELTLDLTTADDYSVSRTFSLTLGAFSSVLAESFDLLQVLPSGWSDESVEGSGWLVTANGDAGSNSIFAENLASTGESILVSPNLGPVAVGSSLSFTHSYLTEDSYDGGVLEISIGGGDWEDVLDAGGTFISGGYSGTLNSRRSTNPLAGRQAWEGDSDGFLTTDLLLPDDAGGEMVRFRWRLGHDSSVGEIGWYLDDISLSSIQCDSTGPAYTLSSGDLIASEFFPENTAELVVETALPVAVETVVELSSSGSAAVGVDVVGLESLMIPASGARSVATLSALSDSLAEGNEELILTTSDGLQSLSFSVLDTPYGAWAFANIFDEALRDGLVDADNDLSPNVEEYLFGTDPSLSSSQPCLESSFEAGKLSVSVPIETAPNDVAVGAEGSYDLEAWSPSFIEFEDGQFVLIPPSSPYFMRLTYELLQTAP